MADTDSINIKETKQLIFLHDAIELGLKKYFTGVPCQHGHLVERYVANRTCVECLELSRRRIYETYYAKNKEKVNARNNANNKIHGYNKKYYQKHKKRLIIYRKEWGEKNRELLNKKICDKRKIDPLFDLKRRLSVMVASSFINKKFNKKAKSQEIIGCSFEYFVSHIEKQFLPNMNWENRKNWHIDHIVPLSSAKTEDELIKLNHFTNLRPMWAKDNLMKSDKFIYLL